MSLFADIMSIQTAPEIESLPQNVRLIYKDGHKDARHEAAELVLAYDNLVDVLESDLQTMRKYVNSIDALDQITEMLGAIHKVKTGEYK